MIVRNGLAHDFAPELARSLAQSFADHDRHLRLVSSQERRLVSAQERFAAWQKRLGTGPAQSVVIDHDPASLPAAWMLAGSNATYAAVLLWQAVRLTAIAAQERYHALLDGTLDPKVRDFLTGASIPGWACALILTALLIWR